MIKLIRLALLVNFLLQLKVSSNAFVCVWDGAEEAPCLLQGLADKVQKAFFDQILILGH